MVKWIEDSEDKLIVDSMSSYHSKMLRGAPEKL